MDDWGWLGGGRAGGRAGKERAGDVRESAEEGLCVTPSVRMGGAWEGGAGGLPVKDCGPLWWRIACQQTTATQEAWQ